MTAGELAKVTDHARKRQRAAEDEAAKSLLPAVQARLEQAAKEGKNKVQFTSRECPDGVLRRLTADGFKWGHPWVSLYDRYTDRLNPNQPPPVEDFNHVVVWWGTDEPAELITPLELSRSQKKRFW